MRDILQRVLEQKVSGRQQVLLQLQQSIGQQLETEEPIEEAISEQELILEEPTSKEPTLWEPILEEPTLELQAPSAEQEMDEADEL
jgi:hypothetical protein